LICSKEPRISELKRFHPKKMFGQNFLSDTGILRSIVNAAAVKPDDTVLEIGPGKGTLTGIIASFCKVIAVEIDKGLVAFLREKFKDNPNVTIIEGDILEMDIPKLLPKKSKLIANIPYYISTPIIFKILENREYFTTAVLTVQKELADRITADHGSKIYGVLTVMVQFAAAARFMRLIPAAAFHPKPDVDSAVLRLDIPTKPTFRCNNEVFFREMVRAGFQHRRKMLRGSLQDIGLARESIEKALAVCGIKPEARPEEIDIPGLVALSNVLSGEKREKA